MGKGIRKITLKSPLKRGEDTITEVELRKPKVGTLRGLQLSMIQAQDVAAVATLLTRITAPALDEGEIDALDIEDFTVLSMAVLGFLFGSSMPSMPLDLG